MRYTASYYRRLGRFTNPGFLFISFLAALSLMKGLRDPNDWAYTHFLFNYDFGFVKRGFIGSLVQLFPASAYSYDSFWLLSFSVMGIIVFLFVYIASRLSDLVDLNEVAIQSIFYSSFALTFVAHTAGYFDHLGLVLVLSTFLLRSWWWKISVVFIGSVACILIHEAFAILFLPSLVFHLLLGIDGSRDRRLTVLLIMIASLVFLTSVMSDAVLDSEVTVRLYRELQAGTAGTSVKLRPDAFDTLWRTYEDNRDIMIGLWGRPEQLVEFIGGLVATLPSALLLTLLGIGEFRRTGLKLPIALAGAVCAWSPLALNIVAWDMHRFNGMLIVSAYLYFLFGRMLCGGKQAGCEKRSPYFVLLVATLIGINLSTEVPLFDGREFNFFPPLFFTFQK